MLNIVCLCIIVFASAVASGQTPEEIKEFNRQSRLNYADVERLIAGIDEEGNATTLKRKYFVATQPHPWSWERGDGIGMLENALKKEKAGSRRWYYLQSVMAFGFFYLGPGGSTSAIDAYTPLVDAFEKDGTQEYAVPVVARAGYEFVSKAGTSEVSIYSDDAKALALRFLQVYLSRPGVYSDSAPQPDWNRMANHLGIVPAVTRLVDKAVNRSASERYGALRVAAVFYKARNPLRAISYLRQALHLKPDSLQITEELSEALINHSAAVESSNKAPVHEAVILLSKGLSEGTTLNPDDEIVIRLLLSQGYSALDKPDLALATLEKLPPRASLKTRKGQLYCAEAMRLHKALLSKKQQVK